MSGTPNREGRGRVHEVAPHRTTTVSERSLRCRPAKTGVWANETYIPTPSSRIAGCCAGKLDAGESALHTATREADEEVDVLIEPDDLRDVHTLHVNGSGPQPRLGLFFETRRWVGEPTNREPDKCSAVSWFSLVIIAAVALREGRET